MLRLGRIFALIAAVMLVIAGAPAMAKSDPCDPCPPDCPMMAQMAASAGDHQTAPGPDDQGDNPCQPDVACQSTVSMIAPPLLAADVAVSSVEVSHRVADPLAARSRPPDRTLRPPIHI